ncbi:MAG: hypothetical protein RJA22_5 [Verrucomicrobiota bacterium]
MACRRPWLRLGLSLSLLLPGLAGNAPAQLPGGHWALAWSDEFNGSSLDATRWTAATGARRDAQNTAAAVSVTNGALVIRTYTEGGVHKTGFVGSYGKFTDAFGYWEARIRFTSQDGMWSAFWIQSPTINNTGNNPNANGTEIDVVEHRNRDGGGTTINNRLVSNVHWDGYGADHKSIGSGLVSNPGSTALQGNWHVFGLLWDRGVNRFYVDGVEVWSQSTAVSHLNQFIYLTSEVEDAGWAYNIPSGGYGSLGAAANGKMEVDWVRFHRRVEAVGNGQFSGRLGNWTGYGSYTYNATNGGSGGPGVRINPQTTGGAAAEQTLHGLVPGLNYLLTGWGFARTNVPAELRLGIKNHGGAQVYQGISSPAYTRASIPFTPGLTNTTARLFAWVPTQYGDAGADDIRVRRVAAPMDPGFESGDKDEYWSPYGDTLVHDWAPVRSGSFSFRFNNPAADRGLEQEIVGLRPATPYRLSCWMRTDNQSLRLGVKNHGAAESSTSRTGSGNTWARHTHVFTTGAAGTSATVYAYIPAANATSVVDVDDFFLAEPLPAGWTAADIGAVGLEGEAGLRGSRWVVRGSGTNLWGSADAFRLVHTNLAGSGLVQARLRSLEAGEATARFGIMVRAGPGPGAPFLQVGWRADQRMESLRRTATNGAVSADLGAPGTRVEWVRVQRAGDVFTAFVSANGVTWTNLGAPVTLPMPSNVLAGLTLCAATPLDWAEGTAENLQVGPDTNAPTAPPLIARGATWRYLAPASGPPLAWRQPAFNDAAWAAGPAEIGYGDGNESTVIPTNTFKPFTAYFRRAFTIEDPAGLAALTLGLVRDDGAVVYLNGVEVWRDNLPPTGPIAHGTAALAAVNNADESTFFQRLLDPTLLVAGTNLLAVEVHQAAATSSDISFDAELTAVSGDADTDNDGLPDAWERAELGGLGEGAAGDPDGDGADNATEWQARTAPASGASRLAVTGVARNGAGQPVLSWPSVPGVSYQVLRATSLGAWVALPGLVAGDGTVLSWTDGTAPANVPLFYRLQVP